MSLSGWSTSNYISAGLNLPTGVPFTWHARVKGAADGGTIIAVGKADNTNFWRMNALVGGKWGFSAKDGAAATGITGGTARGSDFDDVVVVARTASDRELYVNGVSDGTSVVSRVVAGVTAAVVGVSDQIGLAATSAKIAEVAGWNVALSVEDIAALGAGADPLSIRPDALVCLIRGDNGGTVNLVSTVATVTGTLTQDADHPAVFRSRRRQRIAPKAPATTVTLTPSLLTNSQSFYTPKIVETLKPGLFTNSQSFYAPTLKCALKPALLSNAQAFYGPTLRSVVKPGLFTNAQSFYSPYVFYRVRPSLFTNAQVFYAPKLVETLKPGLLSNAQAFYAPAVGVTLKPALLSNAQSFYSPSLKATLKPGLFTNAQIFYAPHAYEPFTPGLFTNAQAFYTPKLSIRLKPGLLTNAQAFYSPTAAAGALLSSLLTNAQVFYGPKLTIRVKPSELLNAQTFYGPTISIAATLLPSVLVNLQEFYGPTVRDAGPIPAALPVLGGDDAWPLAERKERKWKPAYPHLREEIQGTLDRLRGRIKAPPAEAPEAIKAAAVVSKYLDEPIDWDALLRTRSHLRRLETALIAYQAWAQAQEDDDLLLLLAA